MMFETRDDRRPVRAEPHLWNQTETLLAFADYVLRRLPPGTEVNMMQLVHDFGMLHGLNGPLDMEFLKQSIRYDDDEIEREVFGR